MGDCHVDGPDSPPVRSVEEMVGQFQMELITALPGWKERLRLHPDQLGELEREVHATFSRGADLVAVGLVAVVMKQAAFDQACERTRDEFAYPLERGRQRSRKVRMLGGLMLWITSLYCAPRRGPKRDKGEKVPGVYVELAQFGFGKGCTPGLQSKVARQAALCPSYQFAQQELERDGVLLDTKTVRRIASQCGEGLLHLRTRELQQFREGTLPAGKELAGLRVSVQMDGGRTRLRDELHKVVPVPEATDGEGLPDKDEPGRSRKRPRRTFAPQWREPKVATIFVHDEQGRMVKKSQATVDGTFQGPDALAELVAMHLHRLGAAQARSITFAGDGGVWIWERIPAIIRLAGLIGVPIHEVLDCYHATHHIALALTALKLDEKKRWSLYRDYRTMLRNGQWRRVVEGLSNLAKDESEGAQVWTEIAYLRKHGEADRLKYPTFRSMGVPLGSGAIESSIRRVVNLRLKGNAIYWREENAEAMMQVRAQVVTNRWDERMSALHRLHLKDRPTDWPWLPRDMSSHAESITPG